MTGPMDRRCAIVAQREVAGPRRALRGRTPGHRPGTRGGAVPGAPEMIGALADPGRPFADGTGRAPACAGAVLTALVMLEAAADLPGRDRPRARKPARNRVRTPALPARETSAETGLKMGGEVGLQTGPETGLETADHAAVAPAVPYPPRLALSAGASYAGAPCAGPEARMGCFRPPSVPQGRSRRRLTARADLRSDDLAVVRGALTAVAELASWPALAMRPN
ncbi:hypothetical protein GCM10010116_10800 [Microbispora rosea subsp. aerata]|nr:hypothetical protein GCM10010116_10800 [Microbispora rosea subsp. aerata]GIH57266.1 hypothetical protein Mro02_41800 [Microbispora rosea subsp. aerata]GLJ83407.1 hypothetical protein GCM10017588_21350 [Microbispora rosea subsp. aerata]